MSNQNYAMLKMFHFNADGLYSAPKDMMLAHFLKKHLQQGADIHFNENHFVNLRAFSQRQIGYRMPSYQVIHYVAHHGLKQTYQVAKKAGADINAHTSPIALDEAPLHIIASQVNTIIKPSKQKAYEDLALQMLVDGADADARDGGKYTPLILTNNPKLVKTLIQFGADKNAQAGNGESAVHQAARYYTSYFGKSKCHIFVRRQAFLKAKILIESGFDTTLKNRAGKTVLDILEKHRAQREETGRDQFYDLIRKNTPNLTHNKTIKKARQPISPVKRATHKVIAIQHNDKQNG